MHGTLTLFQSMRLLTSCANLRRGGLEPRSKREHCISKKLDYKNTQIAKCPEPHGRIIQGSQPHSGADAPIQVPRPSYSAPVSSPRHLIKSYAHSLSFSASFLSIALNRSHTLHRGTQMPAEVIEAVISFKEPCGSVLHAS